MNKKIILLSGVFALLVYIVGVITGTYSNAGYSNISKAISELMTMEMNNRWLTSLIFSIYSTLILLFSIALFTKSSNDSDKKLIIGATSLFITAVSSYFMLIFPQDIRGTLMTTTGLLHLISAGIGSLCSMLSVYFIGSAIAIECQSGWFKKYSIIMLIIIFISGGLAAYLTSTHSEVLGLFERITIGCFLIWIATTSIFLFHRKEL